MRELEKVSIKDLSSVEHEIYVYVTQNTEKVSYMRIRDLAEQTHVSPSSVLRFIQKMGFTSYPEFRYALKQGLQKPKGPLADGLKASGGIDQQLAILQREIFHPDVDYQLRNMSRQVAQADCLLFIGMGASGAMARYGARKCASLGLPAISIEDPTFPVRSLLQAGKRNVIVLLSVSGETKELIEMLMLLERSTQQTVYCLTQNHRSTLAQRSDYTIDYAVEEMRREIFLDLSSQLPVMVLLEVMVNYLQAD